jgi:hypothetical protein
VLSVETRTAPVPDVSLMATEAVVRSTVLGVWSRDEEVRIDLKR